MQCLVAFSRGNPTDVDCHDASENRSGELVYFLQIIPQTGSLLFHCPCPCDDTAGTGTAVKRYKNQDWKDPEYGSTPFPDPFSVTGILLTSLEYCKLYKKNLIANNNDVQIAQIITTCRIIGENSAGGTQN